jgi:uncharacterized protein (DUF1015 family)
MVRIYDFCGVRPERSAAQSIAAVPYDVVTADEARAIIASNPGSFLRVSRPDAELPDLPPGDPRIYQRAFENFSAFVRDGRMIRDPVPSLYLYEVLQDGDRFLGLCCCLDVEEYRNNTIRRHEQTRYDKEEDRTRHIEAVKAHNGPVVLLYEENNDIHSFLESLLDARPEPLTEVSCGPGAFHRIYAITDLERVNQIKSLFSSVRTLYIADGHHRAKSAVNVVDRRVAAGLPAEGGVTRFMGVMFAHDRVKIHGYSRLLADLGPFTEQEFLRRLKRCFTVREYGAVNGNDYNIRPRIENPEKYHIVHMYFSGLWFECTGRSGTAETCARNNAGHH